MRHADFIRYSRKMKSNDLARNPLVLHLKKYKVQELCVFQHRVELHGVGEGVFVTTRPPHVQASFNTLTRYVWVKLHDVGIDTGAYTPTLLAWRPGETSRSLLPCSQQDGQARGLSPDSMPGRWLQKQS